jgi:hypothetical protein
VVKEFDRKSAEARRDRDTLGREQAYLQQILHQTTHSLARFFLEIDASYKQFRAAARSRAAAAKNLEARRTLYDEGRITADRYLDAVSQYASAVAQEAQFKTTYNISIVALEEAKGTLLAYDNIAVAEGPHPRKAYIQALDQQTGHRQHPIPPNGDYHPRPINGPAQPDPMVPMPPPEMGPEGQRPALPYPVGPLGPQPLPVPPQVPAGEPPILGRTEPAPGPVEPEVRPASIPMTEAAPGSGESNDLPPLPVPIDLPPLPPQ